LQEISRNLAVGEKRRPIGEEKTGDSQEQSIFGAARCRRKTMLAINRLLPKGL